jgi:hypothetical protein
MAISTSCCGGCLPSKQVGGKAERLSYTAFLHDATFISPQAWPFSSQPGTRALAANPPGADALSALSSELDLLHGLAFAAPLAVRPTVITVHDLSSALP